MALCPLRVRLLAALRNQRRSFTSVSEKRLLSEDDWAAFQLQRAERSTLSQSSPSVRDRL
jgi:hypothetical protein